MKFGTLKITTSDGKTRDYPIDQPSISIGRAQGNDLIIEDSSVSRRHARLTIESGHAMIEDLASANGVFIGSQRVPPNTPGLVPESQTVRLGDVALQYTAPPTLEATQAFGSKPSVASLAPAAAPDGPAVNISLVGPVQPVTPGSASTASLTLQNRGSVVDEFIIQVTGLPADWVRLSKERAPLLPNAQETITLTFAPPRKPESTAADHAFVITVISREHRSRATANGTLKVLPFQNFAMNLQPQRSRRDFQLTVHNQGNAPAAYRFGGSDDEQALNYQFGQDAASLQPGQSGAIPLRVAPKIAPRIGTRETRSFSIIASPLDPAAAETKAAGQLIIRPPIPMWLIPLVVLLTALACVIGATVYSQQCGTWGTNLPFCASNATPVINTFAASPSEVEKGGLVVLQWVVSNADRVELIAPAQETLDKNGGVKQVNPEQSTTYTLRATNFAGSIEKSITVKLKNSPPVIQSFKADPAVVTAGRSDKVALSWTIVGADSASIEGVPGASGATGSVQIDPPQADKTYTLVATNGAGTVKQQITIAVSSAGCVLQSAADMREGPSDKYRVIDSLAPGTSVAPVGRNATGEWLRVQANREGWVIASAIQCNVQALAFATIAPNLIPPEPTSTPTATPPPTATPIPTEPPAPTSPPAPTPIPASPVPSTVNLPFMSDESGWVTQGGQVGTGSDHPPQAGDFNNNAVVRGFLSFDLTSIPSNATIQSARLILPKSAQGFGDVFPNFGSLTFEAVWYGLSLNSQAFDSPGYLVLQNAYGPSSAIGVTAGIEKAIQQGYKRFQIRFSFSLGTDNDGAGEIYWIPDAPSLEVVYTAQ